MKPMLPRRAFLRLTALGLATPTLGPFSAPSRAAATAAPSNVKPPLIIDTHTHFYDPTRPQGVPWPPKDDALLYRTVLPKDYLALPKPAPVAGTVVLEASSWVEDNQWILDLAARDPFITGLIGNLPVGSDEFPALLERLAKNPLFRGLRVQAGRLAAGLGQPRFLAHLKLLADKDLALDLVGSPAMLPDVVRLAGAIPPLRIIIDHVAGARVDGKAPPADWLRGMQAAAQHPRVYAKVSGLVEGTGRTDGTAPSEVEFYRPVLDTLWETFGPNRLAYGSNWPVSARFAPLATVQRIVHDYFQTKGTAALDQVFSINARAAYRWVARHATPA